MTWIIKENLQGDLDKIEIGIREIILRLSIIDPLPGFKGALVNCLILLFHKAFSNRGNFIFTANSSQSTNIPQQQTLLAGTNGGGVIWRNPNWFLNVVGSMWETGVGEVGYLGHWQTTPALSAIKDCGVNASTKHRTGTIAFLLNHYERMSPSGAPFFKCDPSIGGAQKCWQPEYCTQWSIHRTFSFNLSLQKEIRDSAICFNEGLIDLL